MSNLIITSNIKGFEKKALEIMNTYEDKNIQKLYNIDIITNENEENELPTDKIREIIKQSYNKPTQLKYKYIVLYNFDRANVQAQNAFLKTLEESQCKIILHANSELGILDTILSRVVITKINETKEPNKKIQKLVNEIYKTKSIDTISKLSKENLAEVIEEVEAFLHENKNEIDEANFTNVVEKLYQLKKRNIETNLNTEIQLMNLFVHLL